MIEFLSFDFVNVKVQCPDLAIIGEEEAAGSHSAEEEKGGCSQSRKPPDLCASVLQRPPASTGSSQEGSV